MNFLFVAVGTAKKLAFFFLVWIFFFDFELDGLDLDPHPRISPVNVGFRVFDCLLGRTSGGPLT